MALEFLQHESLVEVQHWWVARDSRSMLVLVSHQDCATFTLISVVLCFPNLLVLLHVHDWMFHHKIAV